MSKLVKVKIVKGAHSQGGKTYKAGTKDDTFECTERFAAWLGEKVVKAETRGRPPGKKKAAAKKKAAKADTSDAADE